MGCCCCEQSIVLDMPVKGCKTKDNVTVQIDNCIVFHIMGDPAQGEDPELVRTFVHRVTARGLETQLKNAQEEAVRVLARSVNHTEVLGLRSANLKYAGKQKNLDHVDVPVAPDDEDEDSAAAASAASRIRLYALTSSPRSTTVDAPSNAT